MSAGMAWAHSETQWLKDGCYNAFFAFLPFPPSTSPAWMGPFLKSFRSPNPLGILVMDAWFFIMSDLCSWFGCCCCCFLALQFLGPYWKGVMCRGDQSRFHWLSGSSGLSGAEGFTDNQWHIETEKRRNRWADGRCRRQEKETDRNRQTDFWLNWLILDGMCPIFS